MEKLNLYIKKVKSLLKDNGQTINMQATYRDIQNQQLLFTKEFLQFINDTMSSSKPRAKCLSLAKQPNNTTRPNQPRLNVSY